MLEEPLACASCSVFHAILVPLVCGIFGSVSKTEQLKALLLLVGQILPDCVFLNLKLPLCNVPVRCCNFSETFNWYIISSLTSIKGFEIPTLVKYILRRNLSVNIAWLHIFQKLFCKCCRYGRCILLPFFVLV